MITPDGRIEADLTNPALAAIGAGMPVALGEQSHLVGGVVTDEDKSDAKFAKRISDASAAIAGAVKVRDMLRGINPSVLK